MFPVNSEGDGVWNKLPEVVFGVGTIKAFKRHLDRNDLERYGPNVANGTSLDRAFWLSWMSWVKGPISVLYDSMTLI